MDPSPPGRPWSFTLMAAAVVLESLLSACGGGSAAAPRGAAEAAQPTSRSVTSQAVLAGPPELFTVRAYGTEALGEQAQMRVRVDGVDAAPGVTTVTAEPSDYRLTSPQPLTPGSRIDVVFLNDATVVVNGRAEDRNLIVESVMIDGRAPLVPTASGVVLDRGEGAAAFDGVDTLAGQSGLYWSGALRLVVPDAPVDSGDPQRLIKIRARATLAGGTGALMDVRVNGTSVPGAPLVVETQDSSDYRFVAAAPLTAGARIDVIFGNDAVIGAADRNLIIDAVIVADQVPMLPTDQDVTLDRGLGPAATDGIDVLPGQSGLWWDAALRFTYQPQQGESDVLVLYDDVLRSNWSDAGWNASTEWRSSSPAARHGVVSAAVAFTNPYGAFALANWNEALKPTTQNAILLSLRGSSSARYLELFVEGANGANRASVALPEVPAGVWQDVVVYLSDLGSPGAIHRLGLMNDSARMDYTNADRPAFNTPFYVDHLRLARVPPPPTPPAQAGPALSVNAQANRRPIRPEIYGVNWENQIAFAAEIGMPVNRWGGDATSRFNYTSNHSNPGFNWYFENRAEARSPDEFVRFNRQAGSQTILTLPLIGWAAKDATSCGYSLMRYGAQSGFDPFRPDCGTGVLPDFSTAITNNLPTDSSVPTTAEFYRPWIQALVGTHGRADQGGVRYYNLDNEPGIWNSTHRDVVKQGVTHTDLLARAQAGARMLKSVDLSAKTLGPSEDGWARYIVSGRDSELGNWGARYDGLWAVEWYLKEMRAYEQRSGQRLLDYLDLHYYPQAAGVYGAAGSKMLQATRLRSVRSLWDPSYFDESWISDGNPTAVNLIGRMRGWVNTHYPGTGLAITEYNFGALNHINGALAQADVLGVFGREGVDLATLWGPPESYDPDRGLFADKPGAYAFRMFRNYDGAGGQFGDISVLATSADQGQLSVYGSLDSRDGSLKVMIINKTDTPLTSKLALAGFQGASTAAFYRYGAAQLQAIESGSVPVRNQALTATFAAQSITLLRVPSAP